MAYQLQVFGDGTPCAIVGRWAGGGTVLAERGARLVIQRDHGAVVQISKKLVQELDPDTGAPIDPPTDDSRVSR
jgi:hypothetical protein